MATPRATELWLRRHRREIWTGVPEADAHIRDETLALAIHRGVALGESDLTHLALCAECRGVLAHSAPLIPAEAPPRLHRWWWPAGLAAAAAIAFAVLIAVLPGAEEYAPRGTKEGVDDAAVALLAVSATGVARDLRDGESISLSERLGFIYGNPLGRHSTLTILGFDGARIHWYYPEGPGHPPLKTVAGPDARGVRLPFDVALAGDHHAGVLTIAAAFDAEPSAFARALERGETGQAIQVIRVKVVESRP